VVSHHRPQGSVGICPKSDSSRISRGLDDFFNLSPDLLCILGFDGYFKRVNPAVEKTLGFTVEELLSTPWFDLIYPDDRVRHREAVDLLARSQPVCNLEIRGVCRGGSTCWLQWNCRAVVHEGLIYAAARDVTDSYCVPVDLPISPE
jgi:PAS domain S-box-containing protein